MIDSEQLLERLKTLGVKETPIDTLQRWANEGSIPKYTTYYKRTEKLQGRRPTTEKGKKKREEKKKKLGIGRPGRYSAWPPETVEEAAAVWAVRHKEKENGVRITAEMIKIIKEMASHVYHGYAIYTIPPFMRVHSEVSCSVVSHTDIQLQFAPPRISRPDGSDAILLFPGRDKKDKVALLDSLIVKWIAAIAKVRYTRDQEELARQAGRSSFYVWPLERKAVVDVLYRCTPIEATGINKQPITVSSCQFERLLVGGETDTDSDRIFLVENGVDTRILLAHSINFNTPTPASGE